MSEFKTIQLEMKSARNLKNAKLMGKMDVYAVVYVSNNPKRKQKTGILQKVGTNPTWNHKMRLNIKNLDNYTNLVIQVYCKKNFGSDTELGRVNVSLMNLYDSYEKTCRKQGKPQIGALVERNLQVKSTTGDAVHGQLDFSYMFVDLVQINPPPPPPAPSLANVLKDGAVQVIKHFVDEHPQR